MKKVVFWQKNNSKGDQAANLPDDISQSEAKLIILCEMAVFPNCIKTQILLLGARAGEVESGLSLPHTRGKQWGAFGQYITGLSGIVASC